MTTDSIQTAPAGPVPGPVTCFIRYEIDSFQKEAFRTYAENWGRIIPRCSGHLLGYFVPDEGTNYEAWGLIFVWQSRGLRGLSHPLARRPGGR